MTPEAMKLGSDGARSGSQGCWIPKPGFIPPGWWATLPCCPHQWLAPPWFSSPFPGLYQRQETLGWCPIHYKPCATSWAPWPLGNFRTPLR